MADTKITDLTAIDAIASGDLFAVVDDPAGTPASKKATINQVQDYIEAAANVFTTAQTIQPATDAPSLTLRRNGGSQTSKVLLVQTEANAEMLGIDHLGRLSITSQATLPLQTLTDGANIAWNCNLGAKAKVTLEGNRTVDAVTNAIEGTSYLLWVIQDGTGGRTITWTTSGAGSFDFGAEGAPVLTATASRADLLGFEAVSIGGTLKLRFAGVKKGFA
jgi:hypothetical protein